ncbi:putative F-box domain-containing protein [Rosellinia necatrix]|uniref:Putative F-box domain-containing protein n=1 Tax=Rosellinia necatrix TaxID=77044 RepID=A0A1W2TCT5_ROSNE|nr:putative F-box domain-containing protein [Rosellinia necatrix]
MASAIDSDAQATNLARARAYYGEKQFPKATAIFKQVANACVCGVPVRTVACYCKSLVPAIANGTVEAELRKRCICSAKSDVRCRNDFHLNALDGLAAALEAKHLYDTASVIAEAMVNLAPREPKGFLRLGRLLRLQRSYRQAFQTYQQGIDLVGKKNPSHPLLPMLRQMRDKVKRLAVATDPLPILPLELVAMIFRNLDFRSLCHCLRVSKSWKDLLTTRDMTIQSLWRVQCFDRCAKAVRLGHLQKYAAYSGAHVTELIIRDCRQFGIGTDTLRWVAASCRSLKALKLQAPREMDPLADVGLTINLCVPQLTSLYLGFYAPFLLDFVRKIITASAATLQELTILNFPSRLNKRVGSAETATWPVLQRLQTLRLGGPPLKEKSIFNISSFMHISPNVEEVWLEGAYVICPEGIEHPNNPWPRLKRVFVGQEVSWQRLAEAPFPLPSELEELHLMHCDHIFSFLAGPFIKDPNTYPEFNNLRKFTLRDRLPSQDAWPGYLRRWVRPSLESGTLKELGMMFPKPHPSWLRSDELRFLGLKGLSFEFGTDQFAIDDALSDLLERFPNLEGLDIAQEPFSNAALARAIRKGVRIIYHRGEYHKRTDLREWALENYKARVIQSDYILNLPMYLPDERYKDFY